MADASALWLAMAVSAFASNDGSVEFVARAELVDGPFRCWTASDHLDPPSHTDRLSSPGWAVACTPVTTGRRCADWRVSVVRDYGAVSSLLVDAELDETPRGDAGQQVMASRVADLAERAEIYARWPSSSWNRVRLCAGESVVKDVVAPFRCHVLATDGKPSVVTFGRGIEERCVVASGGDDGVTVNAVGDNSALVGQRVFPVTLPARFVGRLRFRLADQARVLMHTPVEIASVAISVGG